MIIFKYFWIVLTLFRTGPATFFDENMPVKKFLTRRVFRHSDRLLHHPRARLFWTEKSVRTTLSEPGTMAPVISQPIYCRRQIYRDS